VDRSTAKVRAARVITRSLTGTAILGESIWLVVDSFDRNGRNNRLSHGDITLGPVSDEPPFDKPLIFVFRTSACDPVTIYRYPVVTSGLACLWSVVPMKD
jgi:hypothetical protein